MHMQNDGDEYEGRRLKKYVRRIWHDRLRAKPMHHGFVQKNEKILLDAVRFGCNTLIETWPRYVTGQYAFSIML